MATPYEGSSFTVLSDTGETEEIPQEQGVKQGCPLSPLVFNLALEGLLWGIEASSTKGYLFSEDLQAKSLAYADDLAIASSSSEDIKNMLSMIKEFASWAHLRFNLAKCTALSTSYRGGKRVVLQTKYQLNGQVIPVMKWEDRYRHLGVLGTWDPKNDHLLKTIGIGRKYGALLKKLCCRDAISGSYEVWAPRCRTWSSRRPASYS